MKCRIIAVFLLFFLPGCATQRIPFPEAELSGLNLSGDKTVKGRVFLIDQLEEKQVGIGSEVTLEPLTAYSEQWYKVSYLQNKSIKKSDPRYEKYVQRTKTDSDGDFLFTGVAPGAYLLTAPLLWKALNCSAIEVKTEVMISLKVNVKDNDSILDIPLTKEYQSPAVVCDLYNQGSWEKEFGL